MHGGSPSRRLALLTFWALCLLLLAAAALAASASASSYSGSGDWTIPSIVNEVVTGETISVSGNLTVLGTLRLVNSSVTVDRNVTVNGELNLSSSTLLLTVDGPGTNRIQVGASGSLVLRDGDGDPATEGDRSLLRADAFGFASTFAAGSLLDCRASAVENAGWNATAGPSWGAGFAMDGARASVDGCNFLGGFEVFVIQNMTGGSFRNVIFDGSVSPLNVTGAIAMVFNEVTFVNHTYGLRMADSSLLQVNGLHVLPSRVTSYVPAQAPFRGTGIALTNVSNATVTNVTLDGTPSAPAPRNLAAYSIDASQYIVLRNLTASWGDVVGSIRSSRAVTLERFTVSYFLNPMTADDTDGIDLRAFSLTGESSSVELHTCSNWTIEGLGASALAAGPVRGFNLTGPGAISNISLVGLAYIADLAWDRNPTFVGTNLSISGPQFGLRLTAGPGANFTLLRLSVLAATASALEVNVLSGSRVVVDQLYANGTTLAAAYLNGTSASDLLVYNTSFVDVSGPCVQVGYADVANFTVVNMTAANVSGPLLQVLSNGTFARVTVDRVVANDSTGVLMSAAFANVLSARVTSVTMRNGVRVLPGEPSAALQWTAALLQDVTVDGLSVQGTLLGGVHIVAARGDAASFRNITVTGALLDGVWFEGGNDSWASQFSNIDYNGTQGYALRLDWTLGAAAASDIRASGGGGASFTGSGGVTLDRITHQGQLEGLFGSMVMGLTVRNGSFSGTYGADFSDSVGLEFDGLYLDGTVATVQAITSSDILARNITGGPSGQGLILRAVTNATFDGMALSASGGIAFIDFGSDEVTLRSISAAWVPPGVGGTVLYVSRSSRVAVEGFDFTGPCQRAASIESSDIVSVHTFRAGGCADGFAVQDTDQVDASDIWVPGVTSGVALVLGGATHVRLERANASMAATAALEVSAGGPTLVRGVDGRSSGAWGAFLVFAQNLTLEDSQFDGAVLGVCVELLQSGPGVVLSNVSARGCFQGVNVLQSSNITLVGLDASLNTDGGLYSDVLSFNNVYRNLTLRANGAAGLVVAANGTRVIDGNISGHAAAGLSAAPGIRLDWSVEVAASLTGEILELTGDLTVGPGALLTLRDTTVNIDQAARTAAGQANTLIQFGPGARLVMVNSSFVARDSRLPYAVIMDGDAAAGAQDTALIVDSTFEGGGIGDPLSKVQLTDTTTTIVGGSYSGWNAPLLVRGGSLSVDGALFTQNAQGPHVDGAPATFANFSTTFEGGNGLTVQGAASAVLRSASAVSNVGVGFSFESVALVDLTDVTALSNQLGGIFARDSNMRGVEVAVNGSDPAGDGLHVERAGSVDINGLTAFSNSGAGASFATVTDLALVLGEVAGNKGSGLTFSDVANASIRGGVVSSNVVFAFSFAGRSNFTVSQTFTEDNGQGELSVSGGAAGRIDNATLTTSADHAVVVFQTSQLELSDVRALGVVAGLLATDSATVNVVNSTVGTPTILLDAQVTFRWHVRVLVENSNGTAAPGATVVVTDSAGSAWGIATSEADGFTPEMTVPEKTIGSAGLIQIWGPHRFNVSLTGTGRARVNENVTRYTAIAVRLDSLTPTTAVDINAQMGLDGWARSEVTLTLRAFDDRPDGMTLSYRIAGGPWVLVTVSESMTLAHTVTVVEQGLTFIEFYAADAAGNVQPVQNYTVKIDGRAPFALFVPVLGNFSTPHGVISWVGDDQGGSGIVSFDIDYAYEGGAPKRWLQVTSATSGTFEAPEDGSYSFFLTARDASGLASPVAVLNVTFALVGTLHFRVVDPTGHALGNASYAIFRPGNATALGTESGRANFEIADLPWGNYTLRLAAPGFITREVNITITAHETLEAGDVVLTAEAADTMALAVAALYGLLGGLGLVTLSYYAIIRRKWSRRPPPPGALKDKPDRSEKRTDRVEGLRPDRDQREEPDEQRDK